MLDIQLLRKDAALVAERLAARGFVFDTARFEALEAERKTIQTRTQEAQSRRNTLSKQIGMMKGKGEDTTAVMAEVAGLGDEQKQLETRLSDLQGELNDFLMGVPNLPHESVAVGKDETANVEVSRWGTPRSFDFPVRDHVDLGEGLGQLDLVAGLEAGVEGAPADARGHADAPRRHTLVRAHDVQRAAHTPCAHDGPLTVLRAVEIGSRQPRAADAYGQGRGRRVLCLHTTHVLYHLGHASRSRAWQPEPLGAEAKEQRLLVG